MKLLKWIALSCVLAAAPLSAQQVEQGIIVTGEGRISLAPDMATITLGVAERGETASEVMAQVTDRVAAILAALDEIGIAEADRQTSGFYLHPVNDDRAASSGSTPRITGYNAGNTVMVRVRDLDRLGVMLDSVLEVGANNFNGLSFGLQDDAAARSEARKAAVADATARAEELAEAAGITLGAVTRITETGHQGGPIMMEMASARSSMGDAIASGEVDVVAQVTMVYSIAPLPE